MNDYNLKKSLNNLIVELDKATDNHGSVLKVEDLSLVYGHLFTEQTKKVMKVVRKSLSGFIVGDVFEVQFFSTTCREDKFYEAAKQIANDINFLAEKGFVNGFLSPLSYLGLHVSDLSLPYAVFAFPSLTPEGMEWLKDENNKKLLKTQTKEGQVGPEFT